MEVATVEQQDSLFGQLVSWLLVNAVLLLGLGLGLGWWKLAWVLVAVNVVLFFLHLAWRRNQ